MRDWMELCNLRARRVLAALVLLVGLASPRLAAAQQDVRAPAEPSPVVQQSDRDAASDEELPEDFEPGLWPTLGAIFPGVLLHGTGMWLAGDSDTAGTLLTTEFVGFAAAAAGLGGVFLTGAAEPTIELFYYPSLVGAAAFVLPWFADIYGASVGGRQAAPRLVLPPVEARAGYAYIYDKLFDYGHFAFAQAEFRFEPFRVRPSAWVAVDDNNQRLRLEGLYRLLGPRASDRARLAYGSHLDLETAATFHHFGSENFEHLVLEASMGGRLDLRAVAPTLRGSFAELALGAGAQFIGYAIDEGTLGEDVAALLLMRTAFGVYFGPSQDRYGEAKLYYNHRHDNFAAGSGLGTGVDGVLGHVGLEGFYYLSSDWGLFADLKAGSAYIALAGVTFRYGGQ